MDADAGMILSSPSTETSRSSSDIATESTGSFFRDRSTTLGTLMGVSLDDDEQGQGQEQEGQDAGEEGQRPRALMREADGWRWRRKWRRRRWRNSGGGWWRMCRDDIRVPTSLGHFLDMERRVSGTGLLCGAGDGNGERAVAVAAAAPLLENGTAQPSAAVGVAGEERGKWKLRRPAQGPTSSSLARLPVLLTAICSGGAG